MFRSLLLVASSVAWTCLLMSIPQAVLAADEEGAAGGAAAETAGSAGADADAEAAEGEETDETKLLLKKLTISMVKEVVDERTFIVRDSKKSGNFRIRLGNTGPPEKKEDMGPATYAEKLKKSREALEKVLGKQMVWFKAAADEFQTEKSEDGDDPTIVADVWEINGRHINSLLKTQKHLTHVNEYEDELARDILSAQAEEEKKQSYKELETALKESEKEKKRQREEQRKAKKAAQEAEENEGEPLGALGWICIVSLLALVVGAAFNFGQPKNKKHNLNRKKGFFEKLMMKVKGS